MTYHYSICYPDTEKIDFPSEALSKDQVVALVKDFDWENELKKEIEYYSPSLDFINISNKKRLILSGIGDGVLKGFQIMYIIPNDENAIESFNDDNYYKADDYTSEFEIEESLEILNVFLDHEYDELISRLQPERRIEDPSFRIPDELLNVPPVIVEEIVLPTKNKKWWQFWR